MNKNQIIQALENASDEQLEQIAAIVGTESAQVPVTGRHVGCVANLSDSQFQLDCQQLLSKVQNTGFPFKGYDDYYRHACFPNPYRVPITHRWSGGKQPVADDVLLLVQYLLDGYAIKLSHDVIWEHHDAAIDVVGYTPLDVIGVKDE